MPRCVVKTNYVLIDYENVQPASLDILKAEHFHVMVFVGSGQAKVTYDVASTLQSMGRERAKYVKVTGSGKNALDFHIAYYIGHLAATERDACFHIVSKDAGFDPLLQHLKSRNVSVRRVKCIQELVQVTATTSKSMPDRVSMVIANLIQRKASHPAKLKTLASTINALFQKSLTESEIQKVIDELTK